MRTKRRLTAAFGTVVIAALSLILPATTAQADTHWGSRPTTVLATDDDTHWG